MNIKNLGWKWNVVLVTALVVLIDVALSFRSAKPVLAQGIGNPVWINSLPPLDVSVRSAPPLDVSVKGASPFEVQLDEAQGKALPVRIEGPVVEDSASIAVDATSLYVVKGSKVFLLDKRTLAITKSTDLPTSTESATLPAAATTPAAFPSGEEATIHEEVETISAGPHSSMPPARRVGIGVVGVPGRMQMTVKNSTSYALTVFFDGPESKKLILQPGTNGKVDLASGAYKVAGKVPEANALPFYGASTFASSAEYVEEFYIGR